MGAENPPRSEDLPPGYDDENPYEEDISKYPEWWQRNIREFYEHNMRPYRPPRFTDGSYTPEIIKELETELGVDIFLRAVNPRVGDDWQVTVNGDDVATIGRHRSGEGYTVYEISSTEFENIVYDFIE